MLRKASSLIFVTAPREPGLPVRSAWLHDTGYAPDITGAVSALDTEHHGPMNTQLVGVFAADLPHFRGFVGRVGSPLKAAYQRAE